MKACEELTVPVVASGASATGRQLAAALAMGAQGITMATRFLATEEAPIRREIKDHMASDAVDERSTTVVMSQLSNATRVFKNTVRSCVFVDGWMAKRVGRSSLSAASLFFRLPRPHLALSFFLSLFLCVCLSLSRINTHTHGRTHGRTHTHTHTRTHAHPHLLSHPARHVSNFMH